jgi:uncharacterized membrane protein YtjA (UPF0391 family)
MRRRRRWATSKHLSTAGPSICQGSFFVIVLVAAATGFRGVAGLSAEIGKIFIVVAVIFLVIYLLAGKTPTLP